MTPDLDRIIAGLSEASKDALRTCDPWDVEVGAGAAIAFICADLLQDSTIVDDALELNSPGLAVRQRLQEMSDARP